MSNYEPSYVENRLALYINNDKVEKELYKDHVRKVCGVYGTIKYVQYKQIGKRRNLVFVEFYERKSAEDALIGINSTPELKIIASWSRPPKTQQYKKHWSSDEEDSDETSSTGSPPRIEQLPRLVPNKLPCSVCQDLTSLRCARCTTTFCSVKCQFNDWTNHETICHAKQAIKPPIDNTKLTYKQCDPPASGTNVLITWDISLNSFFVVSLSTDVYEEYKQTLKNANVRAKYAPKITKQCAVGDFVLINVTGHDTWDRGMVRKIMDDVSVLVALIDYGSVVAVKWRSLLKYEPKGEVICYIFRITLQSVPVEGSLKALTYLRRKIKEKRSYRMEYEGELSKNTKVHLYAEDTGKALNVKLSRNDEKEKNQPKPLTFEELEECDIETSEPTNIVILSNENMDFGIVHCTLERYQTELAAIQEQAIEYGKKKFNDEPSFSADSSDLCLVRDGKRDWQRAVMFSHKSHQCFTIDLGEMIDTRKAVIRKFPDELKGKVYSHQCIVRGFERMADPEMRKQLLKLLSKGAIIKVDKIDRDSPTKQLVLYIPAVMELLEPKTDQEVVEETD